MPQALSKTERDQALSTLAAWTYDEGRDALHRKLVLEDFSAALGLMVRIGIEAEKADHHPEWFNVYNKLDIWLTTHDAGGVSGKDLALAKVIDRLALG
jgi:4a-hydroxytetrahydrobiopterin dehydratase